MEAIKSYTSLEQNKKLEEILPLESADMSYYLWKDDGHLMSPVPFVLDGKEEKEDGMFEYIPCWSLAALLNILDYPQLSKDKLGSGKIGWMVSVYPDNCRYDSCWHDNQIDCCVEMIVKLKELNLL